MHAIHTGAEDGFAFVQHTGRFDFSKGRVAMLFSHFLTGPVCMKFYFYLYGKNNGLLKIRTAHEISGKEHGNEVLKLYGSHGYKWNFAQIYLDFAPTDIYQVIIKSIINDFDMRTNVIAIDDVSFSNETCEHLPQDSRFNCSFDNGYCGWKLNGTKRVKYDKGLKQYIPLFDPKQQVILQSPNVFAHKACFTLQYLTSRWTTLDESRMFIYVKQASGGQLIPVNDRLLYYGHSKWNTVTVQIETEFVQVLIDFILDNFDVAVANLNLNTEFQGCDSVVEKAFFVSTKKIFKKEYKILKDGRSCDLYPTSYFSAYITPTPEYPVPLYIYSSKHHMTLSERKNNSFRTLVGYFYVSMTWRANTSAIHYDLNEDKNGEYISEFGSSPDEGTWKGNVVYVKKHKIYEDNRNCPPGHLGVGNKCFWFLCKDMEDIIRYPEVRCSMDLSTLASLDASGIKLLGEYLNTIQVKNIEITQLTLGLSRKNKQWIWRDGTVYNDSSSRLGNENNFAVLTWNEPGKKWSLKGVPWLFDNLHLCERRRKNFAYDLRALLILGGESLRFKILITTKNLFWAVPGQLDVKLHLNKKDSTTTVPITYPVNITGIKPIYAHTLTVYGPQSYNRPIPELSAIMGYKINGDCNSTSKIKHSNFTFSDVLSKIGQVLIEPMTLTECQLKWPDLCEENSTVNVHGWRDEIDMSYDNRELHILSSIGNTTSFFSYEWIDYHSFISITGICMEFLYKINGDNNILAIYFKSFAGTEKLAWKLQGNHGNAWNSGRITYWPSESLSFVIKAQTIQPNTTVAIGNILVTTESCKSDVRPIHADPAYVCLSFQFHCANGECVNADLVCDGDENCIDGSDEIFCECLNDEFKCERSGECVDARKLCDDVKDCADSSDEQYCHKSCKAEEFYCPSGLCVPWNLTCNGVWNCPDGADEPSVCSIGEGRNETCSLDNLGCLQYSHSNNTSCRNIAGNCDFGKEGLCTWEQIHNGQDNFDWSFNAGETSSKGTGPKVDHTTRSEKGCRSNIASFNFEIRRHKWIQSMVTFERHVQVFGKTESISIDMDSAIAKRMMFIILTDFLCWFPVIIISVLALTGNLYDPSKQVYAWIAVFVLPVNSSINPLLYTFSTSYVREKFRSLKKANTIKDGFTHQGRTLGNGWRSTQTNGPYIIIVIDLHFTSWRSIAEFIFRKPILNY
ncbi:MAM and LDL-receptor class A domain-containing 1-like, partial [Paramuricea clavata]